MGNSVINLDISNKCTLACGFCERQSKSFNSKIFKDMTLEEFKFIADNHDVFFCGQVSDPIYNKNFKEMLAYLYKKGKNTSVHTAAYRNNLKFYEDLFNAHPKATWVFGIDGTPPKSSKHRINQKSFALFDVMLHCRLMGMKTVWQVIVFDFNEKELFVCEHLAKKYDLILRIIHSNRDVDNKIGGELQPKCLEGKELGYSAMGYVMPCCWLAEGNVEKKYPKLCNKNTSIVNKDLDAINKAIAEFKDMLKAKSDNIPLKCWEKCSNKSSQKSYIYV